MPAKNHIAISPDVEANIQRCTFDGNTLILPDPRVVFFNNWPAMKKVFDALGGAWNRKLKVVVFPSDAKALLLPAVEVGGVLNKKQHFQFFPTPDAVINLMLNLVPNKACKRVLEPSAGRGDIVRAVRTLMCDADVDCAEIQDELRKELTDAGYNVIGRDFLKLAKHPVYDLVIMNPPFQNGQDTQHVQHAFGFVKPGGWLVSVMSGGVRGNDMQRCRDFRQFLIANGGSFHDVPADAFRESGTGVMTCIVLIPKAMKMIGATGKARKPNVFTDGFMGQQATD